MPDLRVVVVAADPLARRGLAALLGREPGLTVVAQLAGDGDDGLDAVAARCGRGGMGPRRRARGRRSTAWRGRRVPGLPVLVLVHDEDDALEALAAGARAVLFRDATGERLASAVRAVHDGLLVLDEGLAAHALRPRPPSSPASSSR